MNVFVLNTGRCGSTTFIKACAHITNFSSGHETRSHLLGAEHMAYPASHIEADNRLSWFLGRLEETYGDDALYVHLRRDDLTTAKSFVSRYERGIIKAYREEMLLHYAGDKEPMEVALDYVRTVNSNIKAFLRGKPNQMDFTLENAEADFAEFWTRVGATGDLGAALSEWRIPHNATEQPKLKVVPQPPPPPPSLVERVKRKLFS